VSKIFLQQNFFRCLAISQQNTEVFILYAVPVVRNLYGILTARGPELKIHLNKRTIVKIKIFTGIHVNAMGILNFVRTKYLALNSNWWTLWATYVFYQ